MNSRRLKHKVTFQEQAQSKNDFGEVMNEWTDIFMTFSSIQTISGKETYLSSQNYSTLSHKLRIRYSKLVNTKQRIFFGEREFKILAVLNIFEANKELEILVEEVAQ